MVRTEKDMIPKSLANPSLLFASIFGTPKYKMKGTLPRTYWFVSYWFRNIMVKGEILHSPLYYQLKHYGSNPTTKRKSLNSLHDITLMHTVQHLKMSDENNLDEDKARETN